jgi:hypothetical protein
MAVPSPQEQEDGRAAALLEQLRAATKLPIAYQPSSPNGPLHVMSPDLSGMSSWSGPNSASLTNALEELYIWGNAHREEALARGIIMAHHFNPGRIEVSADQEVPDDVATDLRQFRRPHPLLRYSPNVLILHSASRISRCRPN